MCTRSAAMLYTSAQKDHQYHILLVWSRTSALVNTRSLHKRVPLGCTSLIMR